MAASLPPLVAEPDRWCLTMAEVRELSGRRMVMLPFTAPVGHLRGRRYRIAVGQGPSRLRLIFNVGGQAVIRVNTSELFNSEAIEVRIQSISKRQRRHIPADFAHALQDQGVSIGVLVDHEREQILNMIGESSTAEVRTGRIEAAVQAVVARKGVVDALRLEGESG
jgi:hypothetical protein